jgi:acyl carrier protein
MSTVRILTVTSRPDRRRALRLLLAACGLPASDRFPHPRLSLSHTPRASVAAAVLGPSPQGAGVDLEVPRPVDPRTRRFFLAGPELSAASDPDEHLRLWTVKEALFKANLHNHRTNLHDYTLDDARRPAGIGRAPDGTRIGYLSTRVAGAYHSVAAALPTSSTGTDSAMPDVTFAAVADRLGALLPVPAGGLTADTPLTRLAGDSFAMVELVIDLQEEFGVQVSQAEFAAVDTLGELVAVLRGAADAASD